MKKNLSSRDIFKILHRNKNLLTKYRVRKIGLFGSYGRNESSKKSDIDLLVDFEEKTFDNFIELAFKLEKVFNRKVDLLTEEGISPYILPYIKNEVQWYEA
ncbi:MAG: nucleotidyltransferase family protein [Ignavibacteria bacterium]|nr:nucleotidyltransferase family protein [Ignavibacteria bacterium]